MWPPRWSWKRNPVMASLEACDAQICFPVGPRQGENSTILPTVLLTAEEENRNPDRTKFPNEAVP